MGSALSGNLFIFRALFTKRIADSPTSGPEGYKDKYRRTLDLLVEFAKSEVHVTSLYANLAASLPMAFSSLPLFGWSYKVCMGSIFHSVRYPRSKRGLCRESA